MNNTTAPEVIGTVTITEQSEPIREGHTYYAADHRTYTVLPGVYDVILASDRYSTPEVIVTLDIEITNETLYSGCGGLNFAADSDDTVRKSTKARRFYQYDAAKRAADRDPELAGGAFRLAAGWVAVTRHQTFDNGNHYTSNEFMKLA